MKKVNRKDEKKIHLPLSILVVYSALILIMVITLLFIGPSALDILHRLFIEWENENPDQILFIFFYILAMIFLMVIVLLLLNERIKRRNQDNVAEGTPTNLLHSKLDSDRSYLEQQISELADKLLATQKRWEDVNHLIISSHSKNVNSSGIVSTDAFLDNFNINPDEFKVDKRMVFLLTPFHENYLSDYKAVKSTCDDIGFHAIRGDEAHIKGDILSHIIKCIIQSRIVIANINGRNPNVFYELGIAHALNKPTILISHVENDIPFDISTQYVIIYRDNEELSERLRKMLLQILID